MNEIILLESSIKSDDNKFEIGVDKIKVDQYFMI